jgi:hypothetical protein
MVPYSSYYSEDFQKYLPNGTQILPDILGDLNLQPGCQVIFGQYFTSSTSHVVDSFIEATQSSCGTSAFVYAVFNDYNYGTYMGTVYVPVESSDVTCSDFNPWANTPVDYFAGTVDHGYSNQPQTATYATYASTNPSPPSCFAVLTGTG